MTRLATTSNSVRQKGDNDMSNYTLTDYDGYVVTVGLQEHEAWRVAQDEANRKNESVWLTSDGELTEDAEYAVDTPSGERIDPKAEEHKPRMYECPECRTMKDADDSSEAPCVSCGVCADCSPCAGGVGSHDHCARCL